jgi:hypothetical protein
MEPAPTGEKGGLEMSCPRCGGVLAGELAEAMRELVCPMVVIEGRYCHCDDVEGPGQPNLPRATVGTFAAESSAPSTSEGGPP